MTWLETLLLLDIFTYVAMFAVRALNAELRLDAVVVIASTSFILPHKSATSVTRLVCIRYFAGSEILYW